VRNRWPLGPIAMLISAVPASRSNCRRRNHRHPLASIRPPPASCRAQSAARPRPHRLAASGRSTRVVPPCAQPRGPPRRAPPPSHAAVTASTAPDARLGKAASAVSGSSPSKSFTTEMGTTSSGPSRGVRAGRLRSRSGRLLHKCGHHDAAYSTYCAVELYIATAGRLAVATVCIFYKTTHTKI
jgi:hypothetical protein